MRTSVFAVILSSSFFLLSCSETTTGPGDGHTTPVETTTMFVGQYRIIQVQLPWRIPDNDYPRYEGGTALVEYCSFSVGIGDTSRTVAGIYISAYKVTPGSVNDAITITYGHQNVYQALCVNIPDFYYASQVLNNTNDTVRLKTGTDFLLRLTCIDTAGTTVSYQQISRLGVGSGYGVVQSDGSSYPWVLANWLYRDTTNFNFLLSALPDITLGPADTSAYFLFRLSNKEFRIPIRFTQ